MKITPPIWGVGAIIGIVMVWGPRFEIELSRLFNSHGNRFTAADA